MIAIVDYGLGNSGSILNMLKKAGVSAVVTADPLCIARAKKLILPGVGAFDAGMRDLDSTGLKTVLDSEVLRNGKPVLGICLGMQLMTSGSEEGSLPGLGWILGYTKRFSFDEEHAGLKVPHMGWNRVDFATHSLNLGGTPEAYRFYFVHSYHVVCGNSSDEFAWAVYGQRFVAGFRRDNITAVQFHPEKSHRYGLDFLGCWAKA